MTNSATLRWDKFLRVLFLGAQGAAFAIRKRINGTHARTRRNGSYARRTLAKLTRLECGTRAGWQCKFIQNSKEPSARSTSPCSPHVSPDFSPSLFSVSFSFSFPVVFALPGKTPAVTGMLGSPRKTADYTPENSALRRFVPIDR